jgi:hypothetical protein
LCSSTKHWSDLEILLILPVTESYQIKFQGYNTDRWNDFSRRRSPKNLGPWRTPHPLCGIFVPPPPCLYAQDKLSNSPKKKNLGLSFLKNIPSGYTKLADILFSFYCCSHDCIRNFAVYRAGWIGSRSNCDHSISVARGLIWRDENKAIDELMG